MSNVVQYSDLTEIKHLGHPSRIVEHRGYLSTITTEFFFYLLAPGSFPESAKALGLRPVAAMNNWWPSHCTQARKLVLYWGRNPQYVRGKEPPLPKRLAWCDMRYLAASGCGFKIGEPPMRTKLFDRYFTLMRMPRIVLKTQEKWLAKHNYKHLDTGDMASYYINGWDPDTYNKDLEFKHFGLTEDEWKVKGVGLKYGD